MKETELEPCTLQSSKRILVVGGGAAGLSIVAHLIKNLIATNLTIRSSIEIILFEKNKRIGPGVAYGTTSDVNLLNTPSRTMGIYACKPNHFLCWLQNNLSKWQSEFPSLSVEPDSTPPRRLYGIYLEHVALEVAETAKKHGIRLRYCHSEIVDIDVKTSETFLHCSDGIIISGNIVVLAIGTFTSSSFRHLRGLKGYFSSPYPEEKLLPFIPPSENVCIIGSRLSAIDAILTLKSAGHRGKISCVSRSGMFPCVQGHWKEYKRKFLTKDSFQRITKDGKKNLRFVELLALLNKEIKGAEGKFFSLKNFNQKKASAKTILRREIASASKERKWQSALYDTNDLLTPIWQMLSDEDKKTIVREYLGTFLTFRAAFPIQNAKQLYRLLEKKELEILEGLNSIQYDPTKEKFQVTLLDSLIETNYLIDATGGCSDIRFTEHVLIGKLKEKGLIVQHPFGGINLDAKTLNIIDAYGHRHSRFFVIGGLAKGVHLVTNLLEYIAKTSEKIAISIIEQIKE